MENVTQFLEMSGTAADRRRQAQVWMLTWRSAQLETQRRKVESGHGLELSEGTLDAASDGQCSWQSVRSCSQIFRMKDKRVYAEV